MKKGANRLSDLIDGALAGSLLAGTRGNVYFVDPTNGSDNNDGLTPESAKAKVASAYALTTANQNDVVLFIGGPTGDSVAAALTWSNSYTHLIGISGNLPGVGQRCRIVNPASVDADVLFTLSGNGCIIKNIQFFDGKDSAADGACVLVSGNRAHFENCFFAGMGDSTASGPFSRAGSYSCKVTGSENYFVNSTFGLDTIERTGNNAELIVTGGRNRFEHCDFRCNSTAAGKFLVAIDNSGGDMRDTIFDSCLFFCYSTNWAAGINNAFDMPAGGATHYVILQGDCTLVGVSVGWADTVTRLYTAGAAPNAGAGVAVAVTT